jgi:hypothetical protein
MPDASNAHISMPISSVYLEGAPTGFGLVVAIMISTAPLTSSLLGFFVLCHTVVLGI